MSNTSTAHKSHRQQANSYTRQAGAHTIKAKQVAEHAATWYQVAADSHRRATALARRPWAWDDADYNPATLDQDARTWTRTADIMLRSSFRHTQHAAFYRGLAADYRRMAADEDARLAESRQWLLDNDPEWCAKYGITAP